MDTWILWVWYSLYCCLVGGFNGPGLCLPPSIHDPRWYFSIGLNPPIVFGWVCFSIGGFFFNLYGIKIATFEGIRTLLGGHHKFHAANLFCLGPELVHVDVLNEPTTPPTGRTFCWLTFLTSGLWILPEMDFPPFVLSTRISWDLSLRSPRVCFF